MRGCVDAWMRGRADENNSLRVAVICGMQFRVECSGIKSIQLPIYTPSLVTVTDETIKTLQKCISQGPRSNQTKTASLQILSKSFSGTDCVIRRTKLKRVLCVEFVLPIRAQYVRQGD
jgi:hypothetical protein